MVLRTDLSGNPSFTELLGRVRKVALGAYAHQDVPFEKVVQALKPNRDSDRTPLFRVMFSLQRPQLDELEIDGLRISRMTLRSDTPKFDLTISMTDTDRGLAAGILYKTDLFDSSTIKRMLEGMQVLLESIVACPQQRISDLPLMTNQKAIARY